METAAKTKGIHIKKKNIKVVILLFIISLCVLLGGIYFLIVQRSKNVQISSVDKYGELLDYCDFTRHSSEGEISCKAFLVGEDFDEEEGVCLYFYILLEDGNLKDYTICEDSSRINWENPYPDYSKMVPVNLELLYSREKVFNYLFEHVSLTVLEDEEIQSILFDDYPELANLYPKVWIREFFEISEKGYYPNSSLPFLDESQIHRVFIENVEVVKIASEDDWIVMDLKMKLGRVDRSLEVRTKSFKYITTIDTEPFEAVEVIDSSKISMVDMKKEYQAVFHYLLEEDMPDLDSLLEYCKGISSLKSFDGFCEMHKGKSEVLSITSLDEYITEALKGEVIQLDRFVLNSLLEEG